MAAVLSYMDKIVELSLSMLETRLSQGTSLSKTFIKHCKQWESTLRSTRDIVLHRGQCQQQLIVGYRTDQDTRKLGELACSLDPREMLCTVTHVLVGGHTKSSVCQLP